MIPIEYPERRVAQTALVETALATMDHLKERNERLNQQLAEREARISQLEADLVSARFAGQSHLATVEQLTRINGNLVAAVREIKRAAITTQGNDVMTTLAIADMSDAALRQAGLS